MQYVICHFVVYFIIYGSITFFNKSFNIFIIQPYQLHFKGCIKTSYANNPCFCGFKLSTKKKKTSFLVDKLYK